MYIELLATIMDFLPTFTLPSRIGLLMVLIVQVWVSHLSKGIQFSLSFIVEFEEQHKRDASRPHLKCLVSVNGWLANLTQTLTVGRQKMSRHLQRREQTTRALSQHNTKMITINQFTRIHIHIGYFLEFFFFVSCECSIFSHIECSNKPMHSSGQLF